jgi:hypothetical protein
MRRERNPMIQGSKTSQAAHVTGAITQALQLQPGLSFTKLHSVLQTTTTNLWYPETQQGSGRINVQNTVQALR